MLRLQIVGVQDTINAFGELSRVVRGRNMRIALNAGGGIIRDAAVMNMPSETGLLKKAMKVKVVVPDLSYNVAHHGKPGYAVVGASWNVQGRAARVKGVVKTITTRQALRRTFGGGGFSTRRPARYLHLIERGTKPHPIKATNTRVLSNSATVFGRAVKHPGTRPYQPLTKAVRSSGEAAKRKVIQKLKDGITEWARRRAVRAKVGRIKSVADFINARNLIGS